MIQAYDRVSVSVAGGSSATFDKIDKKSVKQVLAEADEVRRRSIELSERLKQFLAPMSVQNLSELEGTSKPRTKPLSRLLTLQEDDVVEIINDVQDDNQNVMDVGVPRLEAAIKASEHPIHSGSPTDSSYNKQQVGREYKILKQLLKDTEESNRRSKVLVTMMEKTLTNKEFVVKPSKKIKTKRTSDISKSGKTEDKIRDAKRTSNNSTKNENTVRKIRPKTTNETSASKTKRSSKVKGSTSATSIKLPQKAKGKRMSKTINKPRESLEDESSRQSTLLTTSGPSGKSGVKDISDMIDAIGRRSTNNNEIRTYLNGLNKTAV